MQPGRQPVNRFIRLWSRHCFHHYISDHLSSPNVFYGRIPMVHRIHLHFHELQILLRLLTLGAGAVLYFAYQARHSSSGGGHVCQDEYRRWRDYIRTVTRTCGHWCTSQLSAFGKYIQAESNAFHSTILIPLLHYINVTYLSLPSCTTSLRKTIFVE